jgi:hypothetical protein
MAANLALMVIIAAAVLLVLLVVIGLQARRLSRAMKAYRSLVGDATGNALLDVMHANQVQTGQLSERLDRTVKLAEYLELRSKGSLQHVGMVRFNPFEDTGSDQSFAIALLDDRRDGIVLSSLHGRGTTRLFAKPVEGGESRHTLSDEESDAIRIALEGTRPVPTVD